MSYEIELRFRPNPNQTVCARHNEFRNYLNTVPDDWAVRDLPAAEEPKPGESEYFNLKKYTPESLAGDLRYKSRAALEDHKSSDDFLIYTFPANYKGIENFDIGFIENLIVNLSPYYIQIAHSEFTFIDKELRRPLNLRHKFHRFFPVTYFDNTLCFRMFGKDAKDFVEKYGSAIEGFRLLNNGVLYVAPKIFCGIDEAELINKTVFSQLHSLG